METPDPHVEPDGRIEFVDEQDLFEIDESSLRGMVRATLDRYELAAGVDLVFLDDARMQELNRQFLDHDYPTDVLTFPGGADPGDARDSAGEIIVSVETALREAGERGQDAWREIVLYVVHGVLHLAGFDDTSEEAAARMHAETADILASLGFDAAGLDLPGLDPQASAGPDAEASA